MVEVFALATAFAGITAAVIVAVDWFLHHGTDYG